MNERLRRLRDAVVARDREVEVSPDGTVREVTTPSDQDGKKGEKPTKLAPRTFGAPYVGWRRR